MVTQSEVVGRLRGEVTDHLEFDPNSTAQLERKKIFEQKRDQIWREVEKFAFELDAIHEKYRDKLRKVDNLTYLTFMLTHVSDGLYSALVELASVERELQRYAQIAHRLVQYEEIEIAG